MNSQKEPDEAMSRECLMYPLYRLSSSQVGQVGRKAALLGEMMEAGVDVPQGCVLTTAALRLYLEHNGWSSPEPELLEDGALPPSLERTIEEITSALQVPLVVRSSGALEDGAVASFAGIYESFLGLGDLESVLAAVKACWASAFSDRAREYAGDGAALAVIIQEQLSPDAAGVAFSADPVTGQRDVVVIDAVAGLADGLMSGQQTPERWRVGPEQHLESDGQEVLSPEQAQTVAALARKLAEARQEPVDVEWVLQGKDLFGVQVRPITALPPAPIPIAIEVPAGRWVREDHYSGPVTPAYYTSFRQPFLEQLTQTLQRYGIPVERLDTVEIGGWVYTRSVPPGGVERKPPPGWLVWLAARLAPSMRRQETTARNSFLGRDAQKDIARWHDSWKADLQERLLRLQETQERELQTMGPEQLHGHLEALEELVSWACEVHARLTIAHMLVVPHFAFFCEDWLGWDAGQAMELLAGQSPRTRSHNQELARLAEPLRDAPGVLEALERGGSEVLDALSEAHPDFGLALQQWLHRNRSRLLHYDLDSVTLGETPSLVLQGLRSALLVEPGAFDAIHAENARRFEAKKAEVLAQLEREHPEQVEVFVELLDDATEAYAVRDDNGIEAVSMVSGLVRLGLLAIGRSFVAQGRLERADDVLYLQIEEIKAGLLDPRKPFKDTVAHRRGERSWALLHPGVESYGVEYPPPPAWALPPHLRRIFRAMEWIQTHSARSPDEAKEPLRGIPVCPGRYTGRARVIRDVTELGRLQKGDVLVCPITTPNWAVAFGTIGALVTEEGGQLSHPSIVAREFGIPAVIAVRDATRLLKDGVTLTVDGSSGRVLLEE